MANRRRNFLVEANIRDHACNYSGERYEQHWTERFYVGSSVGRERYGNADRRISALDINFNRYGQSKKKHVDLEQIKCFMTFFVRFYGYG